jgi:hypothetical protein
MVGSVFLLVFIGLIIWAVMSAQERSREQAATREGLEQYTTQLGSAMGGATEPVTAMNLVATPPRGEALDSLAEDSDGWVNDIRAAQAEVVQLFPDRSLEAVNQLFNEALALYISSAQTFALVPEVQGELRQDVFARAADQRDTASALWSSAIGVLDQMRRAEGMGPSGLRAPTAPVPDMQPGQAPGEIELPVDPEAGEGAEIEVPVDPDAEEAPAEEPVEGDDGTGEGEAEADDGNG